MDKSIDNTTSRKDSHGLEEQQIFVPDSPNFNERPLKITNSFTHGVKEERNIFKYFAQGGVKIKH
tara:strand:+ start:148 stop:342 length:195 start_codon:yes stop_codon:yes gene_type:complete